MAKNMDGTQKRDGANSWLEEMLEIRTAVALNSVSHDPGMTVHAWFRSAQREISVIDIRYGLQLHGAKIVAGEPAGARSVSGRSNQYPTRKISTVDREGRPIFIVVAIRSRRVTIVTCYDDMTRLVPVKAERTGDD